MDVRPQPVSDVRYSPAKPEEQLRGLLGFVNLRYGDLLLDGLAVRQTWVGRRVLSFPERRCASGRFPFYRPIDIQARAALERAVFAALGEGPGPFDEETWA